LTDYLGTVKIDDLLVFATKSLFKVLILKYNKEKGAAKMVNIDDIIDDVPPTSPNTSNSP
jgi:hypothetical protein